MFISAKRNTIRYFSLSVAILLAMPLGWGKISGLTNWVSPFIMLNSVFALKSLVWLNAIGVVILIATWFKKRFFCRYLCPTGCLLNKIPKLNKKANSQIFKNIPQIGKLLVIGSLTGALLDLPLFIFLDPVAIFNGFFSTLIQTTWLPMIASGSGLLLLLVIQWIWPGLWCKRICPLGGLQLWVSDLKGFMPGSEKPTDKANAGRRLFIGSTAGAAAAIAFPFIVKGKEANIIRPPASVNPIDFYALCTRCGSCLKACPTKILKQDTRFGAGLLTPEVKFETGYCLETCNACSVVCPSGAITLFDLDAKPQLVMGKAVLKTADCLLSFQKECDRCKVVCAYKAVLINPKNNESLVLPEIDPVKCVGCGACKIVCPKNCISIN
ncbi:MAG: 4Fe-4S dicluster domain-containing protein [Mariniphaga sp.]